MRAVLLGLLTALCAAIGIAVLEGEPVRAASCPSSGGGITWVVPSAGQCRGFITSGATFTVPADWSNTNQIETIGGGGGGATAGGGNDAGGGGGGAYSSISNLTGLTPGNSLTVSVGSGGGAGGTGGDTWFNAATMAACVTAGSGVCVGAKGGGGGGLPTAGVGGASASGVGTTKNSGGSGGTQNNVRNGGSGGGGAAGPNGAGANGGATTTNATTQTSDEGTGGGGNGGGGNGVSDTAGGIADPAAGTNGGTAQDSTAGGGGGAGTTPFGTDGSAGSHGSGGGGGSGVSVGGVGGNSAGGSGGGGGSGLEWDATHGSGGGGGGGGGGISTNAAATSGNGGGGGGYGGGGGGGGFASGATSSTQGTGGGGSNGIIVVTYTQVAGGCGFGTTIGGNQCRGFITTTGGGTWPVPTDWSTTNKIEVIGGGGGGAGTPNTSNDAGGGGGGGYSSISNIGGLSGSITVQVGAGGAAGNAGAGGAGGDTFFNRTAGAAGTCADTTSVCAKGGGGGGLPSSGAGGAAASGTGTTTFSGGAGGTNNNIRNGSVGGGGAGGPGGNGKNAGGNATGASGAGQSDGGSGGGGNGGGGAGVNVTDAAADPSSGSNGGTALDTTAGGTGGAGGAAGSPGNSGSHGSGGGGGGSGDTSNGSSSGGAGGGGGTGVDWNSSHGAGGGGGGGGGVPGTSTAAGGAGGAGGLYGGGGGGNGLTSCCNALGGAGGQGIITITYTRSGGGAATGGTLLTMLGIEGARTLPTATIPSAINCTVTNPSNTAPAGTVVCPVTVTTSDGSAFVGSTSITDSSGNFTLSGPTTSPNLVTAVANIPPGPYTPNLFATQNGTQIRQSVPITVPNSGAVPAPAVAAGFTQQVINADFSQPAYSNIATWVDGCGGPTTGDRWVYRWWYTGTAGPCDHIIMEPDPTIGGKQVMHIRFLVSDGSSPASNLSLSFPDAFNVNNNNHFPMGLYVEITFRIAAASLVSQPGVFAIWSPYMIGGPGYVFLWEADDIEVQPNSASGGTWIYGDGGIEWDYTQPAGMQAIGGIGAPLSTLRDDETVYHTYGMLWTTDTTSQIWKCQYLDGGVTTGTATACGGNNPAHPVILTHHDQNLVLNWGGAPTGGAVTSNVDIYIQSVTAWVCPGGFGTSTQCTGLVTH